MKSLLLLVSLLLFTACSPTIKHIKRDLDKNNFKRAMYDLKEIRKISSNKFALIYESLVRTLSEAQIKEMLDLAIKKGANLNASDKNSLTLINYAHQKKDIPLLRYLITKGSVPSDSDALFDLALLQKDTDFCDFLFSRGYNYSKAHQAFDIALQKKNYDKAKYWLRHGADINHDPLHMRIAIDNDDLMLANFLLDHGFKLNNDPLLLTYVIKEQKVLFLALIIAEKFDVNADRTLLSYILTIPDYPLADYLFENGAKLDDPTLFPLAAAKKDYTLMRYLVKRGIKASFPSSELTKAFKEKNLTFAKLLIELGVPFKSNYSPLTYCAMLHYKEGIEYLLEAGADINAKDHFGRTALMYVADDLILTDWLIHKRADVNATDKLGRTTLMYAVTFNDVAESLIIHGADVCAKDKQRRSLLTYAVSNNNMELVQDLVEYKELPVNDEDKEGNRPLNFSQDMEMTRYLMSHNARE